LVAPTLSIGSVLLQQAAIQASFHYSNVEIVESRPNPSVWSVAERFKPFVTANNMCPATMKMPKETKLSTYDIRDLQTDILILTLTGSAFARCNADCK